jgi:hypothetical protein
MATIVIKDLPENTELDRKAMLAVFGGSRLRTGAGTARAVRQRVRLFDLTRSAAAKGPTPRKPAR